MSTALVAARAATCSPRRSRNNRPPSCLRRPGHSQHRTGSSPSRALPRRVACSAVTTDASLWDGAGLLATTSMSVLTGRWYYFAYGSNLNTEVFEGRRGIQPIEAKPGVVHDYRLAFNLPGMPGVEPSFASVEPSPGEQVHGVVFTLDWGGWLRVCQSEGVPFGYSVEPVAVSLYNGETIEALTLRASPSVRVPRERETSPSARYFSLIYHGAMERGLDAEWQQELQRMVS